MTRYLILLIVLMLLAACGGPPSPTPDTVATEVAQAQAIAATLTAAAPTATSTPEPTNTPTATATPTVVPTPTATTVPTETPVPLLQGDPLNYLPSESDMPDGFVINPGMSVPMADTPLQSFSVVYSRDFLEIVGFVVFVASDEDDARFTFEYLTKEVLESDLEMEPWTDLQVLNVDEHASFIESDTPSAVTFFRHRNVVGAVFAAGFTVWDSEYYTALFRSKIEP